MTTHIASLAAEILELQVGEGRFAGGGLVAVRNGEVLIEHYAGKAAPGLRSAPDVLWPVASISKVYTAAMIMRLVEKGVLTLSMPIHLVLPKFLGNGREEMRLRHLLTHTAGFIYESPQMEERLKTQTPLPALIEEALCSRLLFKPGTQLSYADYNYLVAGYVAEITTGKHFAEVVQELVIEPAGLRETFLPPPHCEEHRLALIDGVIAQGTEGAMYNSRYARDLAHPAFGVCASTADLARFGSLFMPGGPRFLSDAAVRVMTTDQTGNVPGIHPSMKGYAANVRIPWAVGFSLQTDKVPGLYSDLSSFQTFGHGGASGCVLVCDPACGIVIAITTNTHLRIAREPWYRRMQSMVNSIFAEFSDGKSFGKRRPA